MRRTLILVAACLSFNAAACGKDATAPTDASSEFLLSLDGSVLGITGAAGGGLGVMGNLPPLPEELALTNEQRADITALIDAFQEATAADREALGDILRRAHEARRQRLPPAEVAAILAQGSAIRARIELAAAQLRRDIDAVLTPEQREWLREHRGGGERTCNAGVRLTAEQQAQIQALVAAFRTAHLADIQLIEATMAEARAARAAGKSREEVMAIMAPAIEAQKRLEAAHEALHADIRAILSAGQTDSGCFTRPVRP